MKIRPLYDRVVVRRKAEEEKTAGGILLPGSAKEKPNQGEVIAVGTGHVNDKGEIRPLEVKVGDKVMFGSYAGNTVEDTDGSELIVMRESDILGIIETTAELKKAA